MGEKEQILKDFKTMIKQKIRDGESPRLKSYKFSELSKNKIDITLKEIAETCNCQKLVPVIYTCANEFLFNGIKANVKRVLFDTNRINIFMEEDYDRGMKLFKDNLSPDKIKSFIPLMKSHGLYTELKIVHSKECITLLISNNVLMTEFEATRIKDKYTNLSGFNSLGEFFEEHSDETEGAGLGITMVLMILKNLEYPGSLKIFKDETRTVVQISFPLVADYKVDAQSAFNNQKMQQLI